MRVPHQALLASFQTHPSSNLSSLQSNMPASLTEAKDALVLRLKFHKSTLFLPCQPTDTLASLKTGFVVAVRSSNQPELSSLPSYTSTDAKSYPSWSDMDPDTDVGLFIASSTGNDAAGLEGMTIFMPLDHDASGADTTVRKAGLKDSDAVCVGFRAQGAASVSQPIVQFTDVEEDDEAADPDSVPPPLSE
ncbi:uncharacterized protein PAN0_016c5216 [Moesziomyces antarcticus]|uniref:Uncharacterized protein n=2 Tax=Pseudozyma antarctica TaxID=84753 RepID=A0A5C3FVF7_PSEA2|nr:uncharacterized protein PAN0_016c5216 [Moesziomyces antarcticus]GAK66991.1 conserved hypothetical protein [Moesziomyces antarcticus]SPO48236.1 uncharacterized protein PSANT_05924 [Moesziomyces antarcticus]